jgi:predicted CXXCH cytochrome family protein
MVQPDFETDEAVEGKTHGRRIRLSMGVFAFSLAFLVLVSFSIYAAVGDEETRFAPTSDNSYMDGATFVGSERCGDCHDDEHDEWSDSLHPKKIQVADDDTVVAPWDADVTIPVADGVDATVYLTKNASGYWVSLDDTGDHTYRVDYVLGGFGWKQRFVTQIGNSKYILPHQWNLETEGWVAYHATDWYDPATGDAKVIAIDQSWDRRCAGCHATGVEIDFNDTSGEWMASYSELGIGCEACHGPGSLHIDPPGDGEKVDYIWNPTDSAACGNCHVRGGSVDLVGGKTTGYPMMDGHAIRPGDSLADYYLMAAGFHPDGETSRSHHQQYVDALTHPHSDALSTIVENDHGQDFCLDCHATDYMLAEEDDRLTMETAMYDIECVACHAPHGSSIDHDLRISQEEVCTQCHNSGTSAPGSSPHHPHQEIAEGTINIDGLSGDSWMDGTTCTDCHMPLVAKSAVSYDIASHTFYVISPAKSIEFTMPNSCTVSCHDGDGPGDALTDEEALAYIVDNKAALTAKYGTSEANVTAAKTALDGALGLGFSQADFDSANVTYFRAKFARDMVGADATFVHNPDWSNELLDYAVDKSDMVVADLTPGSVKGIVKDGDGKAVSGAEIKKGEDVWATTGADGSFEFDIAPGDHTFDVYKGTKKEKSFTATGVASGESTDVETIKFKAEDDSPGFGVIIALLAVTLMTLWMFSDRRN